MHLAVMRAIENFYAIQVSLTGSQASKSAITNLSARLQQDIKLWWSLCIK